MTGGGVAVSSPASRAERRGMLAVTAAGVLWGSIGVVVRLLQDRGASTPSIAFWRFVCASVVLVVVLRRAGLRAAAVELRRPTRLVLVSLGSIGFQLSYFLAVHDLGVATSTLITLGLPPVLLTVSYALTQRSRPSGRTLAVLAIALVGLALVTSAGGGNAVTAPHAVRGVVEAVVSGVLFAASTSGSSVLSARLAPMAITLATSVLGVVLLLPVVAVTGWQAPHSPVTILATAWLGIITTVIAYGLFYAALRSTPSHIAMVLTLLEPVTAVLLAAATLGEPLTIADAFGGLLLLGAICLLYAAPRRSSANPDRRRTCS
jgi:drug/metabolite transporter, DME family